jgi:hypothetical protein
VNNIGGVQFLVANADGVLWFMAKLYGLFYLMSNVLLELFGV